MKHTKYKVARFIKVWQGRYSINLFGERIYTHGYVSPCVRIKEYNRLLHFYKLSLHFQRLKRWSNSAYFSRVHTEVNVGKPSPHSQMLPYKQHPHAKRPRRLSKEKARIHRYSRRKVRQILLLGEDPGNLQFNINNRNLY